VPNVPALIETLPDFVSSSWVGVFLPPRTQQSVANKLSRDFAEVLSQPTIAQRFRELACEPVGNTPTETKAFVNTETARWKKVIQSANIKLE
jgi:tripartite-type tricarboxylate transporter receptor subunit TctC